MLFWWSIVHSTRTQHFLTGDRFGIVREVEIEHDPVVKDVDRVDKGIYDLPLVFRAAHVTLAEFFKPEPNPLTGQDWLFQLFFVLDIFIGFLSRDSTIRFFDAVSHCPFDNIIQRN